ncbi:MAG: PH domain-containing protein, partial [Actinomycetota bacterium]|nr:PH domain-containing protein [Actinomycetota bacterium]
MTPPREFDWQRLNPRMLAVTPLRQLTGLLPVIAVVLVVGAGQDVDNRVYGVLVGVLVVVFAGVLRWLTTRYRITSERVELRSGLLFRSARSIPRDRIRSVDVTAGPVHRLFGLSTVTMGTGERSEGAESRELALDAVSAAEADRLRQRLLDPLDAGYPDGQGVPAPPTVTELAALDWSWLRFAPLTASSLVAVGAVAGAFGQLIGDVGADVVDVGGVRDKLSMAPLWLGIVVFAVLVLVIALVGSVLIFVEAWWGFRLVREPGGALRIRRGLLTTRSVSLEERRLRGVE